jgi:hypothetical protein
MVLVATTLQPAGMVPGGVTVPGAPLKLLVEDSKVTVAPLSVELVQLPTEVKSISPPLLFSIKKVM